MSVLWNRGEPGWGVKKLLCSRAQAVCYSGEHQNKWFPVVGLDAACSLPFLDKTDGENKVKKSLGVRWTQGDCLLFGFFSGEVDNVGKTIHSRTSVLHLPHAPLLLCVSSTARVLPAEPASVGFPQGRGSTCPAALNPSKELFLTLPFLLPAGFCLCTEQPSLRCCQCCGAWLCAGASVPTGLWNSCLQ